MQRVHILIIDENFDFATSLGNLILDVFTDKIIYVENAFNVQDSLTQLNQKAFHFIFLRLNLEQDNVAETKILLQKVSLNHSVRIITLSYNEMISISDKKNDDDYSWDGYDEIMKKDTIDADKLASVFEVMK